MMLAAILEDVVDQSVAPGAYIQETRTYPVAYNTPAWDAACEWIRKHGLDPMLIPGGSLVTRNQFDHSIIYTEVVLDAAGEWILTSSGNPATRVRVERGEAGPWPFPESITAERSPL